MNEWAKVGWREERVLILGCSFITGQQGSVIIHSSFHLHYKNPRRIPKVPIKIKSFLGNRVKGTERRAFISFLTLCVPFIHFQLILHQLSGEWSRKTNGGSCFLFAFLSMKWNGSEKKRKGNRKKPPFYSPSFFPMLSYLSFHCIGRKREWEWRTHSFLCKEDQEEKDAEWKGKRRKK